jgi:transcriptional regulator with XRE-family HTH domain
MPAGPGRPERDLVVDPRRLRTLRVDRGLHQRELAQAAGISKSYLCMLEAGTRRAVSAPVAARLAGALGIAIADLRPSPRLRSP